MLGAVDTTSTINIEQDFQARSAKAHLATMRARQSETELTLLDGVLVTRLDVVDSSSIADAVREGINAFGENDVLINNAGYGAYGPLEATSPDDVRRQFEVNVFGPLATIQAILPHFRANRSRAIVNISSMGGRIAFPLGSLYHGSKFAIDGLSEALAYELASIGVRVKLEEPGMIATDFGGRSFNFSNDLSLSEYQPTVQAVMQAFANMSAQASNAEAIAEVIYDAAMGNSQRLRFEAGDDARHLIEIRRSKDDTAFMREIGSEFKLP